MMRFDVIVHDGKGRSLDYHHLDGNLTHEQAIARHMRDADIDFAPMVDVFHPLGVDTHYFVHQKDGEIHIERTERY